MPQRLLTPSAIVLERIEAGAVLASLPSLDGANLDRARRFLAFHTERRATFLREAGVLKALTRAIVEKLHDSSLLVSALRILGFLIVSLEGATEFVAYGGHSVLLRLLSSSDGDVVCAVEELLVEAGRVAARAGVPFPSLSPGLLADGEVASGQLQQYDFADATCVLVQPVTEAQESQVIDPSRAHVRSCVHVALTSVHQTPHPCCMVSPVHAWGSTRLAT